jgi:hypothetical protein
MRRRHVRAGARRGDGLRRARADARPRGCPTRRRRTCSRSSRGRPRSSGSPGGPGESGDGISAMTRVSLAMRNNTSTVRASSKTSRSRRSSNEANVAPCVACSVASAHNACARSRIAARAARPSVGPSSSLRTRLGLDIVGIADLRLEVGWCCNPKIPEDPHYFEGLMPQAQDLAPAAPDSDREHRRGLTRAGLARHALRRWVTPEDTSERSRSQRGTWNWLHGAVECSAVVCSI